MFDLMALWDASAGAERQAIEADMLASVADYSGL